MKETLKDFQVEAVAQLKSRLAKVQGEVGEELGAVLLNAPTGSGKTLMMTALIEQLLEGSEEDASEGDPDLSFLWLTDQPELNLQTHDKMCETSGLGPRLTVIDGGTDVRRFKAGRLYFLNTQKLGAGKSYIRHGDDRQFTIWETIANTIADDPSKFVLIIDEAHRGAKGREATDADSLMQQFVKGNDHIPAVPVVVGISATPEKFVKLCTDTSRVLRRVDVDPALVRESGLLKDYVDLYHPDEEQPADMTMLQEGIESWKRYCAEWASYKYGEGEQLVEPVLLVQVQDAKTGSRALSSTDLPSVVGTLTRLVPHGEGDTLWLAHAFQDETDHVIAGITVRHVKPSLISADDAIRVVLFKTSLNTGWDCPRAEVIVSFRSAKDEDNIAQLVGRMVRSPLARRIDANEHLNSVALYLPHYNRQTVEKVVTRLTGDPNNVPPTEVRLGKEAVSLVKSVDREACFAALASLPTYAIPRLRQMRPVPRLGKLAALLGELGLETEPVKAYRAALVKMLLDERKRLSSDSVFLARIDENAVLDIRRRRHAYTAADDPAETSSSRARIADQNIDDLHAESGRMLGEGLHREYLRTRRKNAAKKDMPDSFAVKLELRALVGSEGVLDQVNAAAEVLRRDWMSKHKAAIQNADERQRQIWRDIEGSGSDPELSSITPPPSIESHKATKAWRDHLYVEADGTYHEDFRSTWETRVLSAELERPDVVGWLRNTDRKPWAVCVPRRTGPGWAGVYPDFIVFTRTASGVMSNIVDPHLLNDKDAPERARALADFASRHSDRFGRIEMVIFDGADDAVGKRLDLLDEKVRKKVMKVDSHAFLRELFEGL